MQPAVQRFAAPAGAHSGLKWRRLPNEETRASIHALCVKNIAKYALPYEYEFRTELPKTLVGKVAYTKLEEEEKAKLAAQQAGQDA